eukprot:766270-Hanusia_phi.AAC.3
MDLSCTCEMISRIANSWKCSSHPSGQSGSGIHSEFFIACTNCHVEQTASQDNSVPLMLGAFTPKICTSIVSSCSQMPPPSHHREATWWCSPASGRWSDLKEYTPPRPTRSCLHQPDRHSASCPRSGDRGNLDQKLAHLCPPVDRSGVKGSHLVLILGSA